MDPLDMFDIDKDIDFETAYEMLTDFDAIAHNTNHNINHNQSTTNTLDHTKLPNIHNPLHEKSPNWNHIPTLSMNHYDKADPVHSPQQMVSTLASQLTPVLTTTSLHTSNITSIPKHMNLEFKDNILQMSPQQLNAPSPKNTNGFMMQMNSMLHPMSPVNTHSNPNQTNSNPHLNNGLLPAQIPPNALTHNTGGNVHHDILAHNHLSSQGVGDELLSVFETNAIEQFLDTLLSTDSTKINAPSTIGSNMNIIDNQPPFHDHTNNYIPSSQSPKKKHKIKKRSSKKGTVPTPSLNELLKLQQGTNVNNVNNISSEIIPQRPFPSDNHNDNNNNDMITPLSSTTPSASSNRNSIDISVSNNSSETIVDVDAEYQPEPVTLPEITLNPVDYPQHTQPQDVEKYRKWRHVEVEKIRRNQTKRLFDELVIIRNKNIKLQKDLPKRQPKHIQLNIIKNDIINIVKSNRVLQRMIDEKKSKKNH